MKKILSSIFLFSIFINSFSQKIEKIIEFSFDTIDYKYPRFKINETTIDGKILKAIIINTESSKEVGEFLRMTNNTYYFIKKNDSGKIIAEGKAFLEKAPNKKIQLNSYDKNGNVNGHVYFNYTNLL